MGTRILQPGIRLSHAGLRCADLAGAGLSNQYGKARRARRGTPGRRETSVVLTFRVTYTSTTSGLSDKASVNVTENQAPATPPPAGSDGGGRFESTVVGFSCWNLCVATRSNSHC